MIADYPSLDRYHYFYLRDAKSILPDKEYENGLLHFLVQFPKSNLCSNVYELLIGRYISIGQTGEADKYLQKYWDFKKKNELSSNVNQIIYLSVLNEIQKIYETQNNLLEIIVKAKEDTISDEDRFLEKGLCFDDVIGYLHLSLGNVKIANHIFRTLEAQGFHGMLNSVITLEDSYLDWGIKDEV